MTVPFHPDESTYLFTSSDFELFWQSTSSLYWQSDNTNDQRQLHRELDAPLVRNMIGTGRWIAGLPALPVDWDWSKTWQENQQLGALPSPALLFTARMSVAILFPFSILFLYLTARRIANEFTAWTAALLLASNALVLLHTRRAMAESTLLFSITFTLWVLVKAEYRSWATAIPTALAFGAKQTLIALAPVAFLSVLWIPRKQKTDPRRGFSHQLKGIGLWSVIFMGIIFGLHPFLWQKPIPALSAAINARQELVTAQTNDRPEQTLNTPAKRLIGLIGSVYMTPPIFGEVSNYLEDTQSAEIAYLSNPFNNLFRSIPAGAVLLFLSLYGSLLAGLHAFHSNSATQRRLVLLLGASIIQTLALLMLIPLPWQRYYIPLVPFSCLWTAYGLNHLLNLVYLSLHGPLKKSRALS